MYFQLQFLDNTKVLWLFRWDLTMKIESRVSSQDSIICNKGLVFEFVYEYSVNISLEEPSASVRKN
jgi:hypothetical protein